MYRSQYPEAPNLFTNVRRPYRPNLDLSTEFAKSWLTSLIGIAMVTAGIAIIFFNERRTVTTARALDEGLQKIFVPETIDVVFDENNGKLVLLSGPLNIEDDLEDPLYGIKIQAVKLKKLVQMYQWYETEDRRDQNEHNPEEHDFHAEPATYSYARDWFDEPINSNAFQNTLGHHNPETWPFNSSMITNQRVKIGGFLLGQNLKMKFKDYVTFTSDERPSDPNIKMHAGIYYHSKNMWQPEVGDFRVHFSYAGKGGDLVSVVGRQSGREIRPYATEAGEELLFLYPGVRKPDEVFNFEHSQNRLQTWLYRLLGWFLMFLGYNCVSSLLDIIVDDSPQIRRVLVLGVTSLPFSFALSTFLLFLGCGWIIYRPLMGGLLLMMAILPSSIAFYRVQQRRDLEWRRRL